MRQDDELVHRGASSHISMTEISEQLRWIAYSLQGSSHSTEMTYEDVEHNVDLDFNHSDETLLILYTVLEKVFAESEHVSIEDIVNEIMKAPIGDHEESRIYSAEVQSR